MKKKIAFILCLVFALSSLVACGDRAARRVSGDPNVLYQTIVGGSIGGAWAAIGEGVGEVIRRSYPGSQIAYEVGQEASNVALVSEGKVDMGIAHLPFLQIASRGDAPFDRAYDNTRVLAILYDNAYMHFITKKEMGLDNLEDIAIKEPNMKINFNTKDSFMELVGKASLEAIGVTYDDVRSWGGAVEFMSMSASIDLMRDGKLDVYANVVQAPSSHIVDASSNLDLYILPMSAETIKKINELVGTHAGEIAEGTYTFQPEAIPTVKAPVVLFCNENLSEDEAYRVARSLNNNIDYLRGLHSSLTNITADSLFGLEGIELHPGAQKYYDEVKGSGEK